MDPVPAVKAAIVAALLADTALTAEVKQITRGWPPADRQQLEFVCTGKARDREQAAGAGTPRDHDITVSVHVYSALKARTAEQAEERAWQLVALVRHALTPVTQVSGVFARPDGVTTGEDQLIQTPNGLACEVTLEVAGLVRTTS